MRRRSSRAWACLVMAAAASAAGAQSPDWSAVSRIFVERCTMCHSEHGAARGLRLDTYEAVVAGGENGPVVVPGDAAGSELIRRLRGESLPRMPFLSTPLPPEEIEFLTRWVEAGMPMGHLGDAAGTEAFGRAGPERPSP